MVELRLLGALQVSASDGRDVTALLRQSKRTALLVYLAAAVPRGLHRRDTLLALFWPESDETHARGALSQALYVLRNSLGEQGILARGDNEVGLSDRVVWCDVVAFEAALDAGKPDEALMLYHGDLLDGFLVGGAPELEHWLDRERLRLRQRAADGAWALAETKAAQRNVVEAERWAKWAADLSPADEAVVRRLMTFLFGLGDRAAAVGAYEAFAWRVAREYDLEPSAETQALAEAIRHEKPQVPERRSHVPPAAVPESVLREGGGRGRPRPISRRGALAIVLVTAAFALGYVVEHRLGQAGAAVHTPRVLVLPFQNLGEAGDAYFAEGITQEISARLALVQGLTVVGGQFALQYRAAGKEPRQLQQDLGVEYVLEGSVSWERPPRGPGRVRVRPVLINAHNQTQVWAAVLDEEMDMTRLFALLSEIADRVVQELPGALHAPRSPRNIIPTRSLEAYDYYLRGREFTRRTWTANNSRAAVQMLQRAVKRDPDFALARAWLAIALVQAYWRHGLGADRLGEAKQAAEALLRTDPGLPDAHLALGLYDYACCEDYEHALDHFRSALAGLPGDALVVVFIANAYKRQGRWQDAIRWYERAVTLDPDWRVPHLNLAQVNLFLRRYDDAQREVDAALSIEPQELYAYVTGAWVRLLRDGDVEGARHVIRDAARTADGFAESRLPFYVDVLGGDYRGALVKARGSQSDDDARETGPEVFDADDWFVSGHLRQAVVLRLLGDSGSERAQFDSARIELEGRVRRAFPESRRAQVWLRSGLALSYAGLERRADALAQVDLVKAARPLAVDAIVGPAALQNVALTYVVLRDKQEAIDVITQLLAVPARLSPPLLRRDPLWAPLRGEPRYQRLARGGP